MSTDAHTKILGLDIGAVRIGVAIATSGVNIASPLMTIDNSDEVIDKIRKLIEDNHVDIVVVGLPRGLEGQTTAQTEYVLEFIDRLTAAGLNIRSQDEALTSVKAEDELKARRKRYNKEDVDALAATYILEDYLNEQVRG